MHELKKKSLNIKRQVYGGTFLECIEQLQEKTLISLLNKELLLKQILFSSNKSFRIIFYDQKFN
ncbi:hypothetical protein BGV40_09970 [Methanosarcina sp. Ant1]|nr:hypothetical protein BGV40_09970 [Methanosarcina sp. Ant1]